MGVNWCIHSIQRLKEYNDNLEAVDNLTEQIEMLNDRFTAIRSATTDGTPVQGGNENKREVMLINNIETREELQNNLDIVKHEISITEKGLNALSEDEKRILTLFYINRTRGYIDRLCEELFISKTELYRQKDEALKHFTKVCYGIVEI